MGWSSWRCKRRRWYSDRGVGAWWGGVGGKVVSVGESGEVAMLVLGG